MKQSGQKGGGPGMPPVVVRGSFATSCTPQISARASAGLPDSSWPGVQALRGASDVPFFDRCSAVSVHPDFLSGAAVVDRSVCQ